MASSGFNVNDIKTALVDGGARPTLFEIGGSFEGTNFLLHCRAASLPGSNINVIPVNYRGRAIKLPGVRTYDVWNTTFLNDDGEIRHLLIRWMRQMAGMIDGARDATYGPYNKTTSDYRDLSVSQLTKEGKKTITYKLIQAWPVNISDIALDWGTEGFQEFTVTWRYDYFLETTDVGNAAGEGDIIAAVATA
jgi:hypothetical protein